MNLALCKNFKLLWLKLSRLSEIDSYLLIILINSFFRKYEFRNGLNQTSKIVYLLKMLKNPSDIKIAKIYYYQLKLIFLTEFKWIKEHHSNCF